VYQTDYWNISICNTSFCRHDKDYVLVTLASHSYLLAGGDQPECVTCQCPLTVKHILNECSEFRNIRNKYFVALSMKDVFEHASMRNVINFS